MSNANAYINTGLNETIVKFEIDNNQISFSGGELIIVLDIITPDPPCYSDIRSALFKNIIPNLNIPIKSGIHFIYNDSSENEEASTPNTTNITMVSKLFIYIYNTNNVILCNM